jgi:hypothetical protein
LGKLEREGSLLVSAGTCEPREPGEVEEHDCRRLRIAASADPRLLHRPLDVLDHRSDDRRLRVAAKEPAGEESRGLDPLVAQFP